MRGRGCTNCNHTGYSGRMGIYEMLRMNNAIREMTFNREPAQAIRRQARLLGMRTLLEDGVNKALQGITTLEEVLSICHHDDELKLRQLTTAQRFSVVRRRMAPCCARISIGSLDAVAYDRQAPIPSAMISSEANQGQHSYSSTRANLVQKNVALIRRCE